MAEPLKCPPDRMELAIDRGPRSLMPSPQNRLRWQRYEAQVKACDDKLAQARNEAKAVGAQAENVKNKWESTKSALAKKTFDARASPYVE